MVSNAAVVVAVFHLLRGPGGDDHTLYASHTIWQSRAAFEAWTGISRRARSC